MGVKFGDIIGWWLSHPPKNDGVRQWVSDDIPYIMENNPVMFETTLSSSLDFV